jgi:hypothetical protein
LETNHTTGAEQKNTKVTPAAIRRIGHLSATFDICVMRIFSATLSERSPHGLLGIVVEIGGKVRRTNDALELPDAASFMTHIRGAFLDRLRRLSRKRCFEPTFFWEA